MLMVKKLAHRRKEMADTTMKKTYITHMPDKPGALLRAVDIISRLGINITRVSYNKSLDTNTLFIDVCGDAEKIEEASEHLSGLGYLSEGASAEIILLEFKLEDKAGTLRPVLELIESRNFNISYINSQSEGGDCQHFKMGLYVDDPSVIKDFLDSAARFCEVRILNYDRIEKNLDNTVFYITFANSISEKFSFDRAQMNCLLSDSNRIMMLLEEQNEPPLKTFEAVEKYAGFIAASRGEKFTPRISRFDFPDFTVHVVEPACGSNISVIEKGGRLLFVDTGFAIYENEMKKALESAIPGFSGMDKECIISHADIDHCGLLHWFDKVWVSRTSYENFRLENAKENNFREQNPLHEPHCHIMKLMSEYSPPDLSRLCIINEQEPDLTQPLSFIGVFEFEGLKFDVYEGAGGHAKGEIVAKGSNNDLLITGDILVNAKGFLPEQAEFNLLSPYLMTSVNMDSTLASAERRAVVSLAKSSNSFVLPGHGTPFRLGER